MRDVDLFQQALGLEKPWRVLSSEFDPERRRLDLKLDFPRGSRFGCPECSHQECEVHDTSEKTWRHLDFFQHEAYLTARLPRVRCPEHGVLQVVVPWVRAGSGFTLLFEALILAMVKEMPVSAVAQLVGEHDTRIWRVVHHYVGKARAELDLSGVERVGVDETSFRRGHDYVSIFCDLDRKRAIFVTEGRDAGVYGRFLADLRAHGGNASQITELCQDMSVSFFTGALKYLPQTPITFDRYHVKAQLTKAVDDVRREERKEHRELLSRSRYLWLKNPKNLSDKQRGRLEELRRYPLKTVRAYDWALRFEAIYELEAAQAESYLRRWVRGAKRSRLEPIKTFAALVEHHWNGILRWFESKISNGLLEGLNSLIQATKRRARGYRSTRNYIAMIYLVVGKLDLGATHLK